VKSSISILHPGIVAENKYDHSIFDSVGGDTPSQAELIGGNISGFGIPQARPIIDGVKGELSATFVESKIKSLSPECEAKDLIHPNILLWKIKCLSEFVEKNYTSPA